jgi:hypothetical protein
MVPSLALAITADGECLSCDVFSLDETIHFRNLKFVTDRFDGLSLSPMGDSFGAAVMGLTRGGTLSPLWALTGGLR